MNDLLKPIWEAHNTPDLTQEVKIAVAKALHRHDMLNELLDLAGAYADQELDDEELLEAYADAIDTALGLELVIHEAAISQLEQAYDTTSLDNSENA